MITTIQFYRHADIALPHNLHRTRLLVAYSNTTVLTDQQFIQIYFNTFNIQIAYIGATNRGKNSAPVGITGKKRGLNQR